MSGPPPAEWEHIDDAAVTVWVDGLRFDVTLPLIALVAALSKGDTGAILPGALDEDQQDQWVWHLLDDATDFDVVDAAAVVEAVIERLTGVPVDAAVSLARLLADDWLLLRGWFAGRGVDLLGMSPRGLFATLYAYVVEHRYEKREEADRLLFPPRLRPPTVAERAGDAANFEAALAMFG